MNRILSVAAIGVACVLAGACTGTPAPRSVPVEERIDPGSAAPATGPEQPTAPAATPAPDQEEKSPPAPAVVALLAESDRRLGSGQPESAAASIERALRIAPAEPVLWYRLARIRYRQGRWSETETLARKSISLSAETDELVSANWFLIAAARERSGDTHGAWQAKERASDARRQQ